jgi:hypothetical protein
MTNKQYLKLHVGYSGYYSNTEIDATIILPKEFCDMLEFDFLRDGKEHVVYSDTVYLGEIEGKYSEVYGDLDVELINDSYLEKMNQVKINELIEEMEESYGYFENFFEIAIDDSDNEDEIIEQLNLNAKKNWYIFSEVFGRQLEELKEKYYKKLKVIKVEEKDFEDAIEALEEIYIKTWSE